VNNFETLQAVQESEKGARRFTHCTGQYKTVGHTGAQHSEMHRKIVKLMQDRARQCKSARQCIEDSARHSAIQCKTGQN